MRAVNAVRILAFTGLIFILSCSRGFTAGSAQGPENAIIKAADSIRSNDVRSLERYLKKGLDPDSIMEDGKTTLFHLSLFCNNTETISLMIEAGADIHEMSTNGLFPLALAARANNPHIVELLIEKGAEVDKLQINAFRTTALYEATNENAVDAMRVLIDHGADVNFTSASGEPTVSLAAERGQFEALKLLVESGARLHDGTSGLMSTLDWAIRVKHTDMIDYLKSKGAKTKHERL